MFINTILSFSQNFLKNIYQNSYILKTIDTFIGLLLALLIIFSIFAPSDLIGYFAICIIILTTIKMLTKSGEKFDFKIIDKFLLLYFLFVLISLAGSSLFLLSLKGFMKTLTYLAFYISVIHYFNDNRDKIKFFFFIYALSLCFEVVVAFLQNFSCVQEISGWQDMSRLNPEEVMTRVYGSLKPYNPNLFGGYLLATIPVFIAIFKRYKVFSVIASLLSVLALVFTGCRGAYVALFCQIIVLALILFKRLQPEFRKIFTIISTVVASLISLFIIAIPALHARVFSIFAMRGDSSNSFRFNVYQSCIQMFQDNWLLGIGIGNQNFREIYGLYMKTGFDALSAYNIYLETAVESGIFALLAFLIFIILLIKKGFNNIQSPLVFAALISVIGILVHGFVDTVFFRPQIQFTFWFMAAILRGEYGCDKN